MAVALAVEKLLHRFDYIFSHSKNVEFASRKYNLNLNKNCQINCKCTAQSRRSSQIVNLLIMLDNAAIYIKQIMTDDD